MTGDLFFCKSIDMSTDKLKLYQNIILSTMSGIVGLLTLTIGFKLLDKFAPGQEEAVQWLLTQEQAQHSLQQQLASLGAASASTARLVSQPSVEVLDQEIAEEETPIDWMPPSWFPSEVQEDLWVLDHH